MNKLDMQGRGAIVTGGAAGIGYSIAQRLIASGARVSLWDRDAAALAAAAKSLGGNTHTHTLDVTREEEVRRACDASVKALGRIDALVCSAGITGPNTTVQQYPVDAWKEVLDINLTGVFLCNRALIAHMQANELRPHRQYRFDRRQGRQPERKRLQRVEGRCHRVDQIARQGAREDRDPRELRDAGGSEDGNVCADDAEPHRLHAVEDSDGPLRRGR